MHHLDSWIKIDQLDVTRFIISPFTAQHVWMLVHPSSWACDLLWIYFMSCISLVRCVLVLLCGSAGWCGILMQAEALEKYNTWNKSTVGRELLKMDVLTFETCWAVNGELVKRVTSSWSIFIQIKNMHVEFTSVYYKLYYGLYYKGNPLFPNTVFRTFKNSEYWVL